MLRTWRSFLSFLFLAIIIVPVAAQNLGLDIINTRRELSGRIWGHGNWMAFTIDEEEKDLNGDGDLRDTILCLIDVRTGVVQETGLAVNYSLADSDTDWPVAFGSDQIVVQVSEADQGGRDLNGNGNNKDDVLALFNLKTRQPEYLSVLGRMPTFLGTSIFYVQPEISARKDLNGDADTSDLVLCSYDTVLRRHESLGMEAAAGFTVAPGWIATETSEVSQFARDLNDDQDLGDTVVQLYDVPGRKWANTRLARSKDLPIILTSKLMACGVPEEAQAKRDLNNDKDTSDIICHIWDLSAGEAINTAVDCSGGLGGDGGLVGFAASESAQGAQDLNMDRDALDTVGYSFNLTGRKTVCLRTDASGGIIVGGGKIAMACGELDQNGQDLNRDRDADDYVLLLFDPATNKIANTAVAVDGDLVAAEGVLGWKVLEADQAERDLNRDGDTDDLILCVMDLVSGSYTSTGWCAGDYLSATSRGVGFATLEEDQGGRDLNGDKDSDDEVIQIARKKN